MLKGASGGSKLLGISPSPKPEVRNGSRLTRAAHHFVNPRSVLFSSCFCLVIPQPLRHTSSITPELRPLS